MSKVSALFALSITLVFTNANAPTFQFWHELPSASLLEEPAPAYASDYANPILAFSNLDQELSEDDALDRFEIDEMFLPRLNVDLPELFDWSDDRNAYLANVAPAPAQQLSYETGAIGGDSFRFASFGQQMAGRVRGSGGSARIASLNHDSSSSTLASDHPAQTGKGGSSEPANPTTDGSTRQIVSTTPNPSNEGDEGGEGPREPEHIANDDEPTDPINPFVPPVGDKPVEVVTPIVSKEPVEVPTPGAFGLFVLGLAGMRLAGRKKNGSG